jgi:hypothetical protein
MSIKSFAHYRRNVCTLSIEGLRAEHSGSDRRLDISPGVEGFHRRSGHVYSEVREVNMNGIKRALLLVAAVAAAVLMFFAAPASASPRLATLATPVGATTINAGAPKSDTINLTVPVNIVFIGYSGQQINRDAVLAQLSDSYDPVVREPRFYGLPGRDVGLHYRFDYHTITAPQRFEDNFFHHLAALASQGNLTTYQQRYNAQQQNVLNVTGPVLYIDAPSVEAWLAANARSLGVDTIHSYTIFYVNWFNRSDFRFHVYTKTDEPDPDTGVNFGAVLEQTKVSAWGGGTTRTWFYDMSAGPEWRTSNWNVDDQDVTGDGQPDYRIPPIWEYRAGGFRDPSRLSADLGLVTRYVAINELFTPSPLYDPINARPQMGGSKVVSINMLEDDPASSGLDWIHLQKVRTELSALEPYYRFAANLQDYQPIGADAQRAFRIWAGVRQENDCWNSYGDVFAELYCFFDGHLSQYPTSHNPRDYVINDFAFNTTDANRGQTLGQICCYADDNWRDGTQTYVFIILSPHEKNFGQGFTGNLIHENGHHLGLSHPHDGYDSETGLDYSPSYPGGSLYFAWIGNESNTPMSYLLLTYHFGVFNQDNMARWEVAGLLHEGDQLAGQLQQYKGAAGEATLLDSYASNRESALGRLQAWDFEGAAESAVNGYGALEQAAMDMGVTLPSPAAPTAPIQPVPHQVDLTPLLGAIR